MHTLSMELQQKISLIGAVSKMATNIFDEKYIRQLNGAINMNRASVLCRKIRSQKDCIEIETISGNFKLVQEDGHVVLNYEDCILVGFSDMD